jgi:hypothetical protein
MLMNGDLVNGATKAPQGRTPAERVEAIYLATLGRPPQPRELQRTLRHIEAADPDQAEKRYGDVLWALLNGLEFRTNH